MRSIPWFLLNEAESTLHTRGQSILVSLAVKVSCLNLIIELVTKHEPMSFSLSKSTHDSYLDNFIKLMRFSLRDD